METSQPNYLSWDEKTITDFSEKAVEDLYAQGYVFTRIGKGVMQKTRSARIDLSKFELTSENRRILKKTDDLSGPKLSAIPYEKYSWKIGKLAKDFYDTKFGDGVFSANKVKEILTDDTKSNFTTLLVFKKETSVVGYCIAYCTPKIIHYSYPFYDLTSAPDTGLGMMVRTIALAKENKAQYVYLGSLQRPSDTYKLQFKGIEWFDGTAWQSDIETAKEILKNL